MTGDLRIRPMAFEDIPAVMAIASGLKEAPQWDRRAYENAIQRAQAGGGFALVAYDPQSKVAGFLVAGFVPPEAELESIAVSPAWQRQGVARSLFARLVSSLQDRGAHSVFLEVRASNQPALSLYSSLGFAEIGRRSGYYADPPEDAVVLRLDLRPTPPDDPAQP